MDCVENTLVVGTAQRKILIWDLRNWGTFRSISENLIRLSILINFSRRMSAKTRIES